MKSTSDILDRLGRRRVADALGVGITAVGNAATSPHFPASWFFVLSQMCADEGIDCPLSLFRMKGLADQTEQQARAS